MKELTLYIRPEKLEQVKRILVDDYHCGGMTVINVMGCGNQKGFDREYVGIKTSVNLLPKLKVEVLVEDGQAEAVISQICGQLSTGTVGDGKILVKEVKDVIRIRTGERGDAAV